MCDKAVDDCLAVIKLIHDGFGTSKMPKAFHNALKANDDMLYFFEDLSKVTFC